MKPKDYHNYVIKNGKFIGKFEEMYQNVEDPWHHGNATAIQYDLMLYLIDRYKICYERERKIVDIGCGKGAFTARLKKLRPRAQILAIDIAPTAIKKAKQKYGYLGIDFRVMDIRREYKNITEKFDLIIMSQLVWYVLPNFQKIAVDLVKKALKRNGYLLISQAFYKPEEQKYGKEIIQTLEDVISLINLKPIEVIEANRFSNYNAVVLFKNK